MSKREQRRVAVLAVAIRYACSRKSGSASLAQPGCRLDPGLCKRSAYRKAQRTVNKQEASERNACIMEMATGDSQLGKKLLTSRARFSSKNAEPTETWLFHIIIYGCKKIFK
jgi:hypothetical protein